MLLSCAKAKRTDSAQAKADKQNITNNIGTAQSMKHYRQAQRRHAKHMLQAQMKYMHGMKTVKVMSISQTYLIHVKIWPRYDGYKHATYVADRPQTPPHIKIDKYIATENMKRIFTGQQKTAKATAPYRKYIPSAVDIPYKEPRIKEPPHKIYGTCKSVKCILFNHDGTDIIDYDIYKRDIGYDTDTDELHVYLYNKRGDIIEVKPYIPAIHEIAGMTIPEMRSYGVEFYHI